jgi:hypothetical protein
MQVGLTTYPKGHAEVGPYNLPLRGYFSHEGAQEFVVLEIPDYKHHKCIP